MLKPASAEYTLRSWQPSDVPDLEEIFTVSFGDPPEIARAFHRSFLTRPTACTVAAVPEEGRPGGRAVSAMYCLPGPALRFSPDEAADSVYLYALGTLPSWRRRGIGMAVYREMMVRSLKEAPVSCIIPASEDLARKYCEFRPLLPLGSSRTAEVPGSRAQAAKPLPAEPVPWRTYDGLREEILSGRPHASCPESWYRLMEEFGNVFLRIPGALAAVIPLEGRCTVTELLCPEADPARALAGVAAACPAENYTVRTPVFFPGPGEAGPYARYAAAGKSPAVPEDFWYPFGLE